MNKIPWPSSTNLCHRSNGEYKQIRSEVKRTPQTYVSTSRGRRWQLSLPSADIELNMYGMVVIAIWSTLATFHCTYRCLLLSGLCFWFWCYQICFWSISLRALFHQASVPLIAIYRTHNQPLFNCPLIPYWNFRFQVGKYWIPPRKP